MKRKELYVWTRRAVVCGVLAMSSANASTWAKESSAPSRPIAITSAPAGGVFVQLFEWRWEDVANECEQVLGPAGIAAVQLSPANEHIDHRDLPQDVAYAWWARYQPVTYRLESRSGGERALRDMIARCRAVGVEIYADVVLNHMADLGHRGMAGNEFNRDLRQYPDFNAVDFHPECTIADEDYIAGESNAAERAARANRVRSCQLGQLPDLITGSSRVREKQVSYLQRLLDLGVTGLRFDAAKHMAPEDIGALLASLGGSPYVFQEVIDIRGGSTSVAEYQSNGAITEFLYSLRLGSAFADGELGDLRYLNQAGGLLPSENAVVFVDNHDNQRGHGLAARTTHRSGQSYRLANVFMLTWPYGYPRLMSSYEWGGVDDNQGPPHDGAGNTLPVYLDDESNCGNGLWICEHRDPMILELVDLRKRAYESGATTIEHWWHDGRAAIAYSLTGNEAFAQVLINAGAKNAEFRVSTALADGRYCAINGLELCKPITVEGHVLSQTLPPFSALVISSDRKAKTSAGSKAKL